MAKAATEPKPTTQVPTDVSIEDMRTDRQRANALRNRPDPHAEELRLAKERAVRINPLRIQREYVTLPADFAHQNALLTDLYERHMLAELELDRVRAYVRLSWRQNLENDGFRATEGLVNDQVANDARYLNARLTALEVEIEWTRQRSTVRALEAKKDMLVSLGAHIRAEMDGSPSIRDQQAHALDKAGDDPSDPDDEAD